jgi:hypothetical protein
MSSVFNSATQKEPILPVERTTMRLSILIAALSVFAAPAVAENWQEYRYPDQFFAVAFPGDPQAETTTYQVADDRSVEAHVYSVRQDNAVFKVTVAEIADTGLDESVVIDHAIKTTSEGGEIKVNILHRINRVYGRQLSIIGRDGIRSMVALFDYNGRLYQIEGKALPNENDATADAIRFVQSLIFTGGGSNRSADEIRAAQAACGGPGKPEGAAVAGDGRRFEIRCRRQQSLAALVTSLSSGDLSGAQQAYLLGLEMVAEIVDSALRALELGGGQFQFRSGQATDILLGLHPAVRGLESRQHTLGADHQVMRWDNRLGMVFADDLVDFLVGQHMLRAIDRQDQDIYPHQLLLDLRARRRPIVAPVGDAKADSRPAV